MSGAPDHLQHMCPPVSFDRPDRRAAVQEGVRRWRVSSSSRRVSRVLFGRAALARAEGCFADPRRALQGLFPGTFSSFIRRSLCSLFGYLSLISASIVPVDLTLRGIGRFGSAAWSTPTPRRRLPLRIRPPS